MVRPAAEVRVLANAEAAVPLLLGELRAAIARGGLPLVSFATGGTYAGFLGALAGELRAGRPRAAEFTATHLDEYLGFPPARRGGMVHELGTHCPPLLEMLREGTFVPVPSDGGAAALRAHEERLQRAGGVQLQLLGIGRNGHVAFNEPGAPFELGFHVAELAATTRDDARARFAPDEPPRQAATAGLATITAAQRVVLCAFGAGKAAAVRAMLHGPVGPACPATALRRHGNLLVLLDRAAAGGLRPDTRGANE
jgi:glucosamine-6-phosphate deaminase